MVIAALFVERDGVYADRPGIDAWPEERDARKYAGPWPVVAHPPCARWCLLARVNQSRYPGEKNRVGNDGGCFAAALAAVRKFGGVLEHPAYTLAWPAHGLPDPPKRGWQRTICGGWVAHVEQRHFGHRARKATWLYVYGCTPPPLPWGPGDEPEAWCSTDRPMADMPKPLMGKKEKLATPEEFRNLLCGIAYSVTEQKEARND